MDPASYAAPENSELVKQFIAAGFETSEYSGTTYRDTSESFGLYLNVPTVFEEDYEKFSTVLLTWWTTNYNTGICPCGKPALTD